MHTLPPTSTFSLRHQRRPRTPRACDHTLRFQTLSHHATFIRISTRFTNISAVPHHPTVNVTTLIDSRHHHIMQPPTTTAPFIMPQVLELVKRVTPTLKAPLVLFTYYNPIIRRGIDAFCKSISEAGASGGEQTERWCMGRVVVSVYSADSKGNSGSHGRGAFSQRNKPIPANPCTYILPFVPPHHALLARSSLPAPCARLP